MSENLNEAISLDQAVERMMGEAPEADDTTEEIEEFEETDDAEEAEVGESEDDETDADADDDEEADQDDDAEPTFEIDTVDGKKTLTLSELKEGVMLKADYTRKTMALAEERKANDAREAEISQLKKQFSEALQYWAVPIQQEPDWGDLAAKMSPQEFNLARAQYEQRQRQAQQAQKYYTQMQEQERQTVLQREQAALLEKIPEWRDQTAYRAAAQDLTEAGAEYGFGADELAGIVDHRMLLVLRDAAAYRKIKADKPAVTKKVAKAPVAMKPGAKPKKGDAKEAARQKQRAKLKKSGSVDDAIQLLFR